MPEEKGWWEAEDSTPTEEVLVGLYGEVDTSTETEPSLDDYEFSWIGLVWSCIQVLALFIAVALVVSDFVDSL